MTITKERLAEIKARCAEATPGRWDIGQSWRHGPASIIAIDGDSAKNIGDIATDVDAAFICSSR